MPQNNDNDLDNVGVLKINPTASNGREWSCSKWKNKHKRKITDKGKDPDDNQFFVKQLSNGEIGIPRRFIEIRGNGMAEIKSASGRFFIVDPSIVDNEDSATTGVQKWKPNVEVTLYLKVVRHADMDNTRNHFISVSGVSNHFTNVNPIKKRANGRAYGVSCHFLRSNVEFKKETIHGVYTSQDLDDDWRFPRNKWVGIKFVQQMCHKGQHMSLKHYRDLTNCKDGGDWDKIGNTYIDEGNWNTYDEDEKQLLDSVIEDRGALDHPLTDRHQIWNVDAFGGMYIRIDKVMEGYLKRLSVREIDQLP
jgi:hypothetical protein